MVCTFFTSTISTPPTTTSPIIPLQTSTLPTHSTSLHLPSRSVSLFGASASATVLYASRDEFFARLSKDVSKAITRVYSEQLAGWHRRYVSLLALVDNDFPAREVKKPTLSRPASAAARTCYSQRGKLAGRENLLLRQQSGEERATCDPSSPRMSTRARRVVEETTRVVYDRDRRQYVDAVRIKYNPPAQPCEGSQLQCSPPAHRAKPALFGARSKPKKLLLVCPPQRRQVTGLEISVIKDMRKSSEGMGVAWNPQNSSAVRRPLSGSAMNRSRSMSDLEQNMRLLSALKHHALSSPKSAPRLVDSLKKAKCVRSFDHAYSVLVDSVPTPYAKVTASFH